MRLSISCSRPIQSSWGLAGLGCIHSFNRPARISYCNYEQASQHQALPVKSSHQNLMSEVKDTCCIPPSILSYISTPKIVSRQVDALGTICWSKLPIKKWTNPSSAPPYRRLILFVRPEESINTHTNKEQNHTLTKSFLLRCVHNVLPFFRLCSHRHPSRIRLNLFIYKHF